MDTAARDANDPGEDATRSAAGADDATVGADETPLGADETPLGADDAEETFDDSPVNLTLSVRLPRDRYSVPVVRRLCTQSMRSLGVVDADVADVELAIGEACANVIEHSAEGDLYDVRIHLSSRDCSIDVIDRGHGFDHSVGRPDAEHSDESGRGVALMRALVDRVQFSSRPREGFLVHMVKELHFDRSHPIQEAWSRQR